MSVKKLSGYFVRYILAIFIFVSCFIFKPADTYAKANTFGELKQELADLKAKQQANNNKKNLTKNQIASKNNDINNAEKEIDSGRQKIEEAKQLISQTEVKIQELEDKTNQLMEAYQVMMSNNSYLEFVTSSSSMTDLIMRIDAVKELSNYNKDKLTEFEELINTNKQTQVDLANYEKTLEANIETYKNNIQSLQNDLASLNEIGMDLVDEINSKQQLVDYYNKIGCKSEQTLEDCSRIAGNDAWLKPLNKGRVNSKFGQRIDPISGKLKIHKAVDLGGNAEGTNVYSIGNGVVVGIVDAKKTMARTGRKVCGGNQVYIQYVIKGEYYTILYAHLLTLNVSVSQKVTSETVIGKQGGGTQTRSWESCSTGTHLHFQVSKHQYEGYNTFMAYSIVPPGYPGGGGWFYSRTQYFN